MALLGSGRVDSIEFRRVKHHDGWRTSAVVEIYVNGSNLIELVRAFETPMAAAERPPSIAGQYVGLWANDVLPPSPHFLGRPSGWHDHEGKVALLRCASCGEVACWSLVCSVTVSEERVEWSAFEQPHRSDESLGPVWRYDGFGPFVFDRRQYGTALDAVASRSEED